MDCEGIRGFLNKRSVKKDFIVKGDKGVSVRGIGGCSCRRVNIRNTIEEKGKIDIDD